MTTRRLTADARREQLLQTARGVFMRTGFGGTTVREISDAAGVNIALLYRHFESKDELFEEAIAQPLEEALDGLVARASVASEYSGRPDVQRARVVALVDGLLAAMAEITPLLGVVLFSERGPDFYAKRLAPAIGTIAEAAEVTKPNWEHREFDGEPVAMMIFGLCFMYGLRGLFGGPPFDREQVAAEVTGLIFDGLARG